MCGIIGIIKENCINNILNCMKMLEYRGYDSSGIAAFDSHTNEIFVKKVVGNVEKLEKLLINYKNSKFNAGIGHTRWATHGNPTETNAHPQYYDGIAVAHNGIVNNFLELKKDMIKNNITFESDTDTELFVRKFLQLKNLTCDYNELFILNAATEIIHKFEGNFAIVMMFDFMPNTILSLKKGIAPLILGQGKNTICIGSDVNAISNIADSCVELCSDEISILSENQIKIYKNKELISKTFTKIQNNDFVLNKEEHSSFMMKEIHEQPRVLLNIVNKFLTNIDNKREIVRKSLNFIVDTKRKETISVKNPLYDIDISSFSKIYIIGCGSAYYAGLSSKIIGEKLINKQIDIEIASEFRFRHIIDSPNTLSIFVSQSGETFDTISACEKAKNLGHTTLAIVNTPMSTLSKICDNVVFTEAGPEISIASTKGFSTQLMTLLLLWIKDFINQQAHHDINTSHENEISQFKNNIMHILQTKIHHNQKQTHIKNTNQSLKEEMNNYHIISENHNIFPTNEDYDNVFSVKNDILAIAHSLKNAQSLIFLSRSELLPIAFEGALKMKELSYIHSEAMAIGELKHGSFALLDENMPIIILFSDIICNFHSIALTIEEILSRKAKIFLITDSNKFDDIKSDNFHIVHLAQSNTITMLFKFTICVQMLACYTAEIKGKNIDRPRNLAKSVTVE